MKALTPLNLALFFSALLLFTCQQDDAVFQAQTEELTKSLYQQRHMSLKELPQVKSLIDSYSNLNLSRSETRANTPIFELEHILELIDTLSNTNYAFNFRYADTPIGEFYNLIIGKKPDGELRTPYVLKYTCDGSQLETYIANNFEFSSFKGTVSLHRYTDFFELGSFGVRGDPNCPKLDAVGDPIPCETQPVDGGGSGGIGGEGIDGPDSGTGNTGTTDYGGSFNCTYLGIFVTNCNGTNSDSLHAIGSCRGPDLDSATQTAVWDCSSGFDQEAPPNTDGMTTETDCPECDSGNGGVPVNPISIETMRSTLKYNLNLSRAGISYIGKSENNEVVAIVYNYFVPYLELNATVKANAKAHVEAIIETGGNGSLISVFPFIKYPLNSNYASVYPELTILLKEYIPYLKNNTKLINTISNLTGLSNEDIKRDLTWGEGPEVYIEQLGTDVNGENVHGKFNPSEPNKIVLDIDLIVALEALAKVENPTQVQIEQLQLFDGLVTFAVCLHEYVHFADNAFDGTMQDNENLELGYLFEELFVGGYYELAPNGDVVLIPAN